MVEKFIKWYSLIDNMSKKDELIQQWKKDAKALFEGWDFSYLKGRYSEGNPNWDYKSIAKNLIKKSNSVLDMATGGGEAFSEILSIFKPKKAIAIEGYKPNVSVAGKNLQKHGVKAIYANETKKLPFNKGEFDLVLNRHGGFSVNELGRIISSGGLFFTQQVDGRNLKDLMKEFGAVPKWESNTLSNVTKQLKKIGFEIVKTKEWKGKTTFKDIGALVYFLKAIPWIVDNFSVNKYLKILEKLQKRIEKKGKLEFTSRRFLILAKKK
jgi:ubiquinone/menaquinone biosynthesis C-methylase UbiE|tara:strand:- start:69 stop:869 length:801 start_codon:yes stop_codon:yes gene_type:complete